MRIAAFIFVLFLSSAAYGAGSNDFNIPDQTYAAGSYVFTSASLSNETKFFLSLVRTYWTNPATRLTILVETSADNGKTYTPKYSAVSIGGPPNNISTAIYFTNTTGGTRRIRFTVTISGSSLRTSGVFHAE